MNLFLLEPTPEMMALVQPHAWDLGVTIFSATFLVVCVLVALWHLFARRDPLMLLLLIGGGAGVIMEPICNVLALAYYPETGLLWGGVKLLGHKIPWWAVLLYPWYFGGPISYVLVRWYEKGYLTPSRYWKITAISIICTFLFEVVPKQYDLWIYYGPAPYRVLKMPLLWYAVNPTTIIATAAFCAIAVRNRQGWQRWPIVFLAPICITGFHTGLFAPTVMSMHAGWSATQTGLTTGLITIAFSVVLLWTFSRLLFSGSSTGQKAIEPA